MKRWHVVALVLFVFGLATVAFAAPPEQASEPQGHVHRHGLNLTAEQREKMGEIMKNFRAHTHDLRYDIRMKGLEVRKLFTDPKADNETILAKEKELDSLKLKLMDMRAEMKIEWRKVLTPAQIAMLDRFHGRFGHRGHRHPGFEPHPPAEQ